MSRSPSAVGTESLLHTTDWSATPLGPMAQWPRSLLSYVSMIMAMPTPAIVFWGEEQIQLYNDGYAVIMGPRHPRYFGARYRDCWPDTYPTIHPWMRSVLDEGRTVQVERAHIPVTRYGFEEDAYFTFTFSALRDDEGRIAGILQPVFDVSAAVLADRRTQVLRALSPGESADALGHVMAAIGSDAPDLPFARVYLRDEQGDADVLHEAGRTEGAPLDAATDALLLRLAHEVLTHDAPAELPRPPALLLPIADAPGRPPRGVIALGRSTRLHFDDAYRKFMESVALQVAAALQRADTLQAAQRRRAWLHRLFMQAPAGIAVMRGPELVFELANPRYRQIVGARELLGLPLVQALPEIAGQGFPDLLHEVMRSGRPYVGTGAPVLLHRTPGVAPEEAFFNFVFQPLEDVGGAPAADGHADRRADGVMMFCYEVTDQVHARREAEALADELRLEHRRKDEFLATLAHELRNPLAPISAAADVLAKGVAAPAQVQRTSEIVARQVRHLTGLVNDLLDVSRVTRGLVDVERHPEDLREVLQDATEQVRPLIESRGHAFSIELPPGPACVTGDRKRLVQIVANLLANAAKYTPDGGAVDLRLELLPQQVRVQVRDNGIGIAPALQASVFDLFVQAERSTDRAQGGLGIGLALVKRLVELHGGSVHCHSDGPGRGSVFTLLLPRREAAEGECA